MCHFPTALHLVMISAELNERNGKLVMVLGVPKHVLVHLLEYVVEQL